MKDEEINKAGTIFFINIKNTLSDNKIQYHLPYKLQVNRIKESI